MAQRTQHQSARLRAQRRATERTQAKHVQGKRQQTRRTFPAAQLVGGLATILIVAGILAYAVIQSNSVSHTSTTTGQALANPSALHPAKSILKVGQSAPNFTLTGADGKRYSLAAQRGHPVLLEFFAVWCPHCQREAPTIERLKLQYASQGLRVWSVLANPYGPQYDLSYGQDKTLATKADLKDFQQTYHEYVPQLIDPNFHVVNTYGVSGYPGLYVLDKQGKIVYVGSGEQPQSVLTKAINQALHGKA